MDGVLDGEVSRYRRRRNQGELPARTPSVRVVDSFCRFIGENWGLEDWKVSEARSALEWFVREAGLNAGGGTARGLAADLGPAESWRERVMAECRRLGHSLRTEKSYAQWTGKFITWWRSETEGDGAEAVVPEALVSTVERAIIGNLDHLAVEANSAVSTQRQALNALYFPFGEALRLELGDFSAFRKARRRRVLPVVLTKEEVQLLMHAIDEEYRLLAELLYGGGLCLMEGVRLRVKDLDFGNGVILVRDGKGGKDRRTMLPGSLEPALKRHLSRVRMLHERDLADGHGSVHMPGNLAKKWPKAGRDWIWQYVFPAKNLSKDPRSDVRRRHHVHETKVRVAVKQASRMAGIAKRVTPHTLRHSLLFSRVAR